MLRSNKKLLTAEELAKLLLNDPTKPIIVHVINKVRYRCPIGWCWIIPATYNVQLHYVGKNVHVNYSMIDNAPAQYLIKAEDLLKIQKVIKKLFLKNYNSVTAKTYNKLVKKTIAINNHPKSSVSIRYNLTNTIVLTWIVRDFTANKDYHFKTEEEAWAFAKKLEKIGHKYQLIRPTASEGFHYGSPVSAPKHVKPKPIAVTDPFHSTIHLKKPIPKDVAKSIAYEASKKLGVKEIQKHAIHNIKLTHNKIHQPRAIQHTKRVVHVQNPHVVHDVKHTHHHVVHPVKHVHHPIRSSHKISPTKHIHHEQIQHVKEKTTSVVSLHGVNLAYVAGGIVVALLLLFLVIK